MTSKKILITRQYSRSKELSKLIEEVGHQPYFLELFKVVNSEAIKHQDQLANNFKAVIITSANAINCLISLNFKKNIKIYSIGNITTKKLQAAGFNNILTSKPQNAKALEKLIIDNHKSGEILHLQGPKITLDFSVSLAQKNIKVSKQLAYQIKPITKLQHNLANIDFDYVLIFSNNSAKIFLNLVNQDSNLKQQLVKAKILCFSTKIIAEFKKSDFKNIALFQDINFLKSYYDL